MEHVWRSLLLARQAVVWVEITTLAVAGVNNADVALSAIAGCTVADLGAHTSWHVSGCRPAYRCTAPPTLAAFRRSEERSDEEPLRPKDRSLPLV